MATSNFSEAWLDGPGHHKFYTRTYAAKPSKAVIVFLTGFTDHVGRYEEIHTGIAQHGFTVFAYDMRGFGRTALDAEHRSADEYYGKTRRDLELSDLQWWIEYVGREYEHVPIFLLGFSAGAALASAFVTRTHAPPSREIACKVSGIIELSPLYRLARQPPAIVRYAVQGLSKIAPAFPVPTPVPAERFSHDPTVAQKFKEDRLRMSRGTAQGLHDMISQGEKLVRNDYKNWPKALPLLMLWGTADQASIYTEHHAWRRTPNPIIRSIVLVEYEVRLQTV
ncbi:hypothetical protein NUW54_g3005 [Trametes sanguinea]|uniref:Uncharacterized protein n=2 Tax=Trametes sanguinea TaxID=158606 RepID=A0ACC1PZB6_9APHY|nr:hypothetical protein NUW54_g3950 [Trametes sanguinea]KAJ3008836.1 hypothetical protein NUW54_g3005 [Trametes sanguinea]